MITKIIKIYGAPGTGKTTTLLKFLEKELNNHSFDRIAYISYTRSAIKEARSRVLAKFNSTDKEINYFRTLHAICWRLLGLSQENKVTEKIIKDFCNINGVRYKEQKIAKDDPNNTEYIFEGILNEQGNILFGFNNYIKDQYITDITKIDRFEFRKIWAKSNFSERLRLSNLHFDAYDFLVKWEIYKKLNNLYEYTDMLLAVLRKKLNLDVDVLFVDEAQDSTNLQFAVYFLWTKDFTKDIWYVAGDDDQAIYEFGGSNPHNFLDLEADYETKLGESHRCSSEVVEIANQLIRKIKKRKEKNFNSKKIGAKIYYFGFDRNRILLEIEKNIYKESIYFLFRTNYLENKFRKFLNDNHIPHSGIKKGSIWSKRMINISNAIFKINNDLDLNYDEFFNLTMSLKSKDIIRKGLKTELKKGKYRKETYDINDLIAIGYNFEFLLNNKKSRFAFIGGILPSKLTKSQKNSITNIFKLLRTKINIYTGTMHSAKGTEADVVFICVDYSKRIKDLTDSEIKVFYTAITRTKKDLILFDNFVNYGNKVSNKLLNECGLINIEKKWIKEVKK